MDLMQNELVKKYFGPKEGSIVECCEHEINRVGEHLQKEMALRILTAMQKPIKKGERMLAAFPKEITEEVASRDIEAGNYPRSFLRLPDSFQTKECEYDPHMMEKMADFKWCGLDQKEMRSMRDFALSKGWSSFYKTYDPPPPDPVEEKITDCVKRMPDWPGCENYLRELVSLARQSGTR